MKRAVIILYAFFLVWLTAQNISAQNHYASNDNIPVLLPETKNSFIENGKKPSGFRIRGTKGWSWTPEQYLEEIPVLAKYHMNFLMNCYLSMFSQPFVSDTSVKMKNEWWLPVPDAKKIAYERIFKKCRKYGITFCFALNPQLASPRPLDPASDKDFENIWDKYSWAQNNGVHWFCVSLDDVSGVKIDGIEQSKFVNKLISRLRKKDKGAQMIFCPTYFAGDGTSPKQKDYLEALAKNLDSSVYVFWTGSEIVPATITLEDAETFKGIVKHKVILWDNYPVNDGNAVLHLAPITGRDKNLCKVIDGYMSNPFFAENEINRIPLFTMADYSYDPVDYDPGKSIGQAIIHQTGNMAQQLVLLKLVQLFSGEIGPSGSNTVIDRFRQITSSPYSRYLADLFLCYLQKVLRDLKNKFPAYYNATKKILSDTIRQVQKDYQDRYGTAFKETPLE